MGFLFHVIRLPTAITGAFILNLWSQLKFLAIGALTHLGLYKPPPDDQHDSSDISNNYIFIFDGTCPSLVPIPIHVVTVAIKAKVPILQFQDLLLQEPATSSAAAAAVNDTTTITQKQKLCTICLDPIDLKQEVRQLPRCTHVFHRDCLDTWIDSSQVTCPLCRSMLLPPKTNLTRFNASEDPPPSISVQDNGPLVAS